MSTLVIILLATGGTILLAGLGGYYFTSYGQQWAMLHKRIRTPLVRDKASHPFNPFSGLGQSFADTDYGRSVAEKLRVADLAISPMLYILFIILFAITLTAVLNLLFAGAPFGMIIFLGLSGTFLATKTLTSLTTPGGSS